MRFFFTSKLLLVLFVLLLAISVGKQAVLAETEDEGLVHSLIVEGDQALMKGREYFSDALAKYSKALQISPSSIRALFSKAQVASRMRENSVAISDLTTLLKINFRYLPALELRSSLAIQEGDLATAADDLDEIIKIYRAQRKSAKGIREAEERGKKLRALSRQWTSIQDTFGADPLALPPLSSPTAESARKKRFMECIQLLHRIEDELNTESVTLRVMRIGCAVAVHRGKDVIADIKYVLHQNPQNILGIVYNAMAMRSMGALSSAKKELHRCFSIDPENPSCAKLFKLIRNEEANSAKVQSFMKDKNYPQALAVLNKMKASEYNPPYASQLEMWRCETLVQLKKVEDGLDACGAVLDSEAFSEVDIRLLMAELHIINDDIPAAEAQLSVARDILPNHEKVMEMARKIERLRQTSGRKNYYKILGISKSANDKEIHRAYRKFAKELHPDKLRSKDLSEKEKTQAAERFRHINEAKEILLNPEKRAAYDRGEDPNDESRGAQQGPFYGQEFHFASGGFPNGFSGSFSHPFFSTFAGRSQGQGSNGRQNSFFFSRR